MGATRGAGRPPSGAPPDDTPSARLGGALEAATSVRQAAERVVAHLEAAGLQLPSLYLEQAGRLRCIAQRGYWQVIDGIPNGVGVVGRTYRSGRVVEVADAHEEEDFLFAAPELRCQISVPLRVGGEVVGTLNAESVDPLPSGTRALLEEAATAFEVRLTTLGGPPRESVAQRIARLVTAMTELEHEADIRRTALHAATEIAGMSTAAIIEPAGPDAVSVVSVTGPLGDVLLHAEPGDLTQLDRWVLAGTSLVASGTDASDLVTPTRLQRAGVASLTVVPLRASGGHLGSLVLADEVPSTFEPVVVPALEVLGAQAAASIRAARTIAALRRRARQDPLTELGHHATFQEELRARLATPRAGRHLAVFLIDVDDFKRINDRDGHQQGDRVLRQLSATLGAVLRSDDRLYRVGGDEFACLVEVATLDEARDIATRMADAARQGPVTISVGIALAGEDEAADALVDRADAAMYVAKSSGRDRIGVAQTAVAERLW